MTKAKLTFFLLLLFYSEAKEMDPDKKLFCSEVKKCKAENINVCGIRWDGERYRLKVFTDECELLKYGCDVEDDQDAYGIINMEFCNHTSLMAQTGFDTKIECIKDCPEAIDDQTTCGIRQQDEGFKVRLFANECEMLKHNCEKNFTFNITDDFICKGLKLPKHSRRSFAKIDTKENEDSNNFEKKNAATEETILEVNSATSLLNAETVLETQNVTVEETTTEFNAAILSQPTQSDNKVQFGRAKKLKVKNVIVVDGNMFDSNGNVNDTIENFFSATHVFDMPLKDISRSLPKDTRRMLIRVFGPVMVFKPWITIPKNISEDKWHKPTLSSCFHTCPKECPDTYAPVCGTPGVEVREPSILFKNHCLMDAAQCKMRWDDASFTAESSAYIESSFTFCLSDTLNGLYRFLPLIRTLQHMGRLKRKGRYRIRLRNMRFFNELLHFSPKVMG